VDGFAGAEARWADRLGTLRNVVRQELIARQLAEHVAGGESVLDVGCGQGTQAIRLARRGCRVVGVDPSTELLARLHSDAASAGVDIETIRAELDALEPALGLRRFDLVCAHGLLMYLDDERDALTRLAVHVGDRGRLSVTFRNRAALAFRPGMRQEWPAALAAFDASTYVNELGVRARAHHLEDITALLARLGLEVEAWYGVRVFTDPAAADAPPPDDGLATVLEAEFEAGRRDPYRHLGSQLHVIARRRE